MRYLLLGVSDGQLLAVSQELFSTQMSLIFDDQTSQDAASVRGLPVNWAAGFHPDELDIVVDVGETILVSGFALAMVLITYWKIPGDVRSNRS